MPRSLYVQVSQAVDNLVIKNLTRSEYAVLRFINERTLRYDKEWEFIPMRHFLEGVFKADGTLLHAGLPYAKSSIIKAYQGLIDKGYLLKNDGTRNKFSVNYQRLLEVAHTMALAQKGLKFPKKPRRTVTERTVTPLQTVTEETSPNKEQSELSTRYPETDVSETRGRDIQQRVEKVQAKARAARAHKAKKLAENLTYQNVRAAWAVAHQKHRKDRTMLALTQKDFFKLRASWRAHKIPMALADFIEVVVRDWSMFAYTFRWVEQGYPQAPDFPFLSRMLKFFIEHMAQDRDYQAHLAEVQGEVSAKVTVSPRENAKVLRRMLDEAHEEIQQKEDQLRESKKSNMRLRKRIRKAVDAPVRVMREIGELEVVNPNLPLRT